MQASKELHFMSMFACGPFKSRLVGVAFHDIWAGLFVRTVCSCGETERVSLCKGVKEGNTWSDQTSFERALHTAHWRKYGPVKVPLALPQDSLLAGSSSFLPLFSKIDVVYPQSLLGLFIHRGTASSSFCVECADQPIKQKQPFLNALCCTKTVGWHLCR